MDKKIEEYWNLFQNSLLVDSEYLGREFVVDAWGNTPQMANELGALIVSGIKTAACSTVIEWEQEGQIWPGVGALTVVVDGQGIPLCIIETIHVQLKKFIDVGLDFAYEEGEGDRSLEYWRQAHRGYFGSIFTSMGKEFSDDTMLVCEKFRVVYRG